jgi:hypothetical protein
VEKNFFEIVFQWGGHVTSGGHLGFQMFPEKSEKNVSHK